MAKSLLELYSEKWRTWSTTEDAVLIQEKHNKHSPHKITGEGGIADTTSPKIYSNIIESRVFVSS